MCWRQTRFPSLQALAAREIRTALDTACCRRYDGYGKKLPVYIHLGKRTPAMVRFVEIRLKSPRKGAFCSPGRREKRKGRIGFAVAGGG